MCPGESKAVHSLDTRRFHLLTRQRHENGRVRHNLHGLFFRVGRRLAGELAVHA